MGQIDGGHIRGLRPRPDPFDLVGVLHRHGQLYLSRRTGSLDKGARVLQGGLGRAAVNAELPGAFGNGVTECVSTGIVPGRYGDPVAAVGQGAQVLLPRLVGKGGGGLIPFAVRVGIIGRGKERRCSDH
jgi:hypothetical protein